MIEKGEKMALCVEEEHGYIITVCDMVKFTTTAPPFSRIRARWGKGGGVRFLGIEIYLYIAKKHVGNHTIPTPIPYTYICALSKLGERCSEQQKREKSRGV